VIPADATCWTLIHAAAAGDRAARDVFARLYEPIARAYFAARWRETPGAAIDDAVQDVFVECFKPDGVLDRVVADQPDGFRAFFHGVLKNIARRREAGRGVEGLSGADPAADETSLSRAFDRAWAQSLLQEAARLQVEAAATQGDRAVRRVELLRLRFQGGLPVREIADRWGEDPAKVHHEYATARAEFKAALGRVMAFHRPAASAAEIDAACRELLGLLA
jgi:RNA polymerase sigma factor (sigma-70 family)